MTSFFRFVSLHHTDPEGYTLLSVLVEKKLVIPKRDIWTLFNPAVTQPVTESVNFLIKLTTVCDIPKNFVPNFVCMATETIDTKYPLRKQLIQWLLPYSEEESESSRSSNNIDPYWTALALVTLTLRDAAKVNDILLRAGLECQNEVEESFLEIALELPFPAETMLRKRKEVDTEHDIGHMSVVLLEMENAVTSLAQSTCQRVGNQVMWAIIIAYHLSFCLIVVHRFIEISHRILQPGTRSLFRAKDLHANQRKSCFTDCNVVETSFKQLFDCGASCVRFR